MLYTERHYAVDAHSVVSIIFSINWCNRRRLGNYLLHNSLLHSALLEQCMINTRNTNICINVMFLRQVFCTRLTSTRFTWSINEQCIVPFAKLSKFILLFRKHNVNIKIVRSCERERTVRVANATQSLRIAHLFT
jgi:hypothetical protein